jgi:hemolysin D
MLSEDDKKLYAAPDDIAQVYGGVASKQENETRKKDRSLEVVESQNPSSKVNEYINPAKFRTPDADNWSSSLHSVLDQPPVSLPQRLMLAGMIFSLAFVTWAISTQR